MPMAARRGLSLGGQQTCSAEKWTFRASFRRGFKPGHYPWCSGLARLSGEIVGRAAAGAILRPVNLLFGSAKYNGCLIGTVTKRRPLRAAITGHRSAATRSPPMKRMTAVLLTAFFLSAPVSAVADDGDFYIETKVLDLRDVEAYLWKASALEGKWRDLEYRQQWVMSELIDICYTLAETKAALADAVHTADWNREEKLERQYVALKAEEGQLWDEFERLNK